MRSGRTAPISAPTPVMPFAHGRSLLRQDHLRRSTGGRKMQLFNQAEDKRLGDLSPPPPRWPSPVSCSPPAPRPKNSSTTIPTTSSSGRIRRTTGSWATRPRNCRARIICKTLPPATGFTKEEIEAKLKQIKLPPGFKIELYASGVTDARQMAWGDKGTLFVGSLFGGGGTVHAVVDEGGKRTSRTRSRD